MVQNITKVQALVRVIRDNGGQANWKAIYRLIGKYYDGLERTEEKQLTEIAKAGIRGVLYRDCDKGRNIFTKIGEGTFKLK